MKLAILATLAACQEVKPPANVGPAGQGRGQGQDATANASLAFTLPESSVFTSLGQNSSSKVTSYGVRLAALDQKCSADTMQKIVPFSPNKSESLSVNRDCRYQLTVALGQGQQGSFVAYYETTPAVYVDSQLLSTGSAGLDLYFTRTESGLSAQLDAPGFRVPYVNTNVGTDPNNAGPGIDPNAGKVVYEGQVKSIFQAKCVSCHSPTGSRPTSDLTTFENARLNGELSISKVNAGAMPPKDSGLTLTQQEIDVLNQWKNLGFPQGTSTGSSTPNTTNPGTTPNTNIGNTNTNTSTNSSTNTGNTSSGNTRNSEQNTNSGSNVVEFRIPAGTGNGDWNTEATKVTLRVGQTLRIINDDNVAHYLHTNGRPCPHGNRSFGPGQSYDCQIRSTFSGTGIRDHNLYGKFFIEAVQ